MQHEPEIKETFKLTKEFIEEHLDDNNNFNWRQAGIGGDYIIGLCHSYFPVVGIYRFSHSADSRDDVNELIGTYDGVKTREPHCIVKRGTQLDVFAFDKGIFAYVMLKIN